MIKVSSLPSFSSERIVPLKEARDIIKKLKKEGKTVGLCHGGFDLLHPGHVKHFESAKALCDILFVSVTADSFVTKRKGDGRPVFTDRLRAYMIASVRSVDYVVIIDFKLGVDVIKALSPSYYIKGPDFIGKQTPGITAERAAIAALGGKIIYTKDPKLSTTNIISYVQNELPTKKILLVLDRDGTIITNDDFVGSKPSWKQQLTLNEPVVSAISLLQTKYKTTTIVVSNQSGVARGLMTLARVKEVNDTIGIMLEKRGIKIDSWQFCPDVDTSFAKRHPETLWKRTFVKDETNRKPSPGMIIHALKNLGKTNAEYEKILVLGNHEDDRGLAKNLDAVFIDIRSKTYEDLVEAIGKAI